MIWQLWYLFKLAMLPRCLGYCYTNPLEIASCRKYDHSSDINIRHSRKKTDN